MAAYQRAGAPQKRCTEGQLIPMLQEAEAVGNVREVCRQHNSMEQTFYRWRSKFGRRDMSDVKRLRALERENAALQRRVGELSLGNRRLRDVLGKGNEPGGQALCRTVSRNHLRRE